MSGLHADYNRGVRRGLSYSDRYGYADSDAHCNGDWHGYSNTKADAHTEISADT